MFLLSDASRWITGSSMAVDGGYTAKGSAGHEPVVHIHITGDADPVWADDARLIGKLRALLHLLQDHTVLLDHLSPELGSIAIDQIERRALTASQFQARFEQPKMQV